jgi:hypothetical protein
MTRKPPETVMADAVIRQRLRYLHARRSVVDQLIRALELYAEMEAEEDPPAGQVQTWQRLWTRQLAS